VAHRRLIALAGVALAFALAGCHPCGRISQLVSLDTPDAELQTLVDSCVAGMPAAGEQCADPAKQPYPPIGCGCRPLCERVLAIIDQFAGSETLIECHLLTSTDGGTAVSVNVTYHPSTCG
jgi:hypothetical protein